jgi:2-methylaconitate cis-trans-isomerase PrpF
MDATLNVESEQIAVPATWMRGGTSNALFFLETDLPPAGPLRDALIKRAMGCPDVLQIDGIGGGRGNTSKIAIIGISDREDADITYTFAQVGIAEDTIDYRATCGNISAAVGPFAVLKGLVRPVEPTTSIRIYNSNIDDILFQSLEVRSGQPRVTGDFVNAGVPGSGAEIFTDFSRAIGRRTGKMLPTGHVRDLIQLSDGRAIEATLLDVGNPVAYLNASALGIVGNETPAMLLSNVALMNSIREIRPLAADLMGLGGQFSVRVGLVSEPSDYIGLDGEPIATEAMDLCSRFFALDYCAPNYPGTAAVSTGAAARLPGSVVHTVLREPSSMSDTVRIGHPNGVMDVVATARSLAGPPGVEMVRLGFGRTARALMEGITFVPRDDLHSR